MFTTFEATVAPRSSMARAVRLYVPEGTPDQTKLKGASDVVAMSVSPKKKSTPAMVPSESAASAVRVILAGAVKVAFAVGLVRLRLGKSFTRIKVAVEGLAAPSLSMATAVSL